MISIIVTTYGTQSFYTQACLESIRRWKSHQHELIVVTHDESLLLRAYLDACVDQGLIDRLVFAESNHGHTRGFNLGVQYAGGDVVFNICNDILIGPSLVDDCAWKLRTNRQLGIIGWHWYSEGVSWRNGRIEEFVLRDPNDPDLPAEHEQSIRGALWFTGRYFEGIGGAKWLHLCNTSFFGARKELLELVGGGFGAQYPHYWSDDFLCYAVLDQGFDIQNFDRKFRSPPYFYEFPYSQMDVGDRRRNVDAVRCERAFLDSVRLVNGGMTEEETVFLHLLAQAIPNGAVVTNVGVWHGSSAMVLLDALRSKAITFHFIDCFDTVGISAMSAQPPVMREEFLRNIQPYVGRGHTIDVVKANSLDLDRFPRSDFIFVDAGHTEECIGNDARLALVCLTPRGVAAFHDYGCPFWPAVKPALDATFPKLDIFGTVAVYRKLEPTRESYQWLNPERSPRLS